MTSKNLFFKLMLEDMKTRLWSIALSLLGYFVLFPVVAAFLITRKTYHINQNLDPATVQYLANRWAATRYTAWLTDQGVFSMIMLFTAVIMAVTGFSWLFNSKTTDFYHSIPVKRQTRFFVICLDSLLIIAVPYFVMSLLGGLIVMVNTKMAAPLASVIPGFLLHMALFFLCYMTACVAVMMTGNLIVSILGVGVFFIYGPAIVLLTEGLFSLFATHYPSSRMNDYLMHSSPMMYSFLKAGPLQILWALLFGCILAAVALKIYLMRPSEAAGKAMAFKRTELPIRFLIMVPVTLIGALACREAMGHDGWMIFGFLFTLIAGSCIMEIIYHFDFKKLFDRRKCLVLTGVAAALILAVFRFDWIGYDLYMPARDKLVGAGITTDDFESNLYGFNSRLELEENQYDGTMQAVQRNDDDVQLALTRNMEFTDLDVIYRIATRGITDSLALRKNNGSTDDNGWYSNVVVTYHLKNGKTKTRSYMMNLSALRDDMDAVYNSSEFKTAAYPVFSMDGNDIAGINYKGIRGLDHLQVTTPESKKLLWETYCREFMALTADDRRKEAPIASLQFKTAHFQEMADTIRNQPDGYLGIFNDFGYYPVYPSFTDTLALLKEAGFDAAGQLSADNFRSIMIQDVRSYKNSEMMPYENHMAPVTITDKEELAEILKAAIPDVGYYDQLNRNYYGLELTCDPVSPLTAQEMSTGYANFYIQLKADEIPKFLLEKFGITEEDIALESSHGY